MKFLQLFQKLNCLLLKVIIMLKVLVIKVGHIYILDLK